MCFLVPLSKILGTSKPRSPQRATALLKTISALLLLFFLTSCAPPRTSLIVIGAKNFSEQVILGELFSQEIEAEGGGRVDRRFWLAGSYLCQQALVSGRIDGYVEYTGTALTAILKQPLPPPAQRSTAEGSAAVTATLTRLYAQRYRVRVGPSLGFQDTFALVIRADDAQHFGLHTLSDLARVAPQWRLGVGYEFAERPDGLPGLAAAYNLRFAGPPRTMELGLLYRSLGAHQVDVVAGNSTDGAIQALGFVALIDDRHYFPPYDAVPLVSEDALARHPAIGRALERLAGAVSEDEMRAMNLAVDGQHRDPADVVRAFRQRKGL